MNETPKIRQLLTSLDILIRSTLHALVSEKIVDEVCIRVLGDMLSVRTIT